MADDKRVPVWPLMICWLVSAAALVARALLTADTTPLILDTDDAMRLVQVRDLLAGQGWFDPVQHRLNTPYGAEIHWSRLIDLPLAALLMLLRPLLGSGAETVLVFAWPLLLLGAMLWLTAGLALRLGGRSALWPALLLPAFSLVTLAEFAPGRLDHHGVQILLALAMLTGAIDAVQGVRGAVVAGIAAGLGLAIGIEAVPMVAVSVATMGLLWVSDARHGPALRAFGLSFAATTVLGLMQGVPPERWLTPGTDAISATYALAALLCGLAFTLLPLLRTGSAWVRLGAGVTAGLVVLGATVASAPALLRGPYGQLDPWLLSNWIDRISEAEPWLPSFAGQPIYAMAVGVPVLTGVLAALWNVIRRTGPERTRWLIQLGFMLAGLLVMALQIRAARLAVPLALPATAVLVGVTWRVMVSRNGFGPILAMLGSAVASAGIGVAVVAVLVMAMIPGRADTAADPFRAARNACLQPEAFAQLAALPPQRVMTPVDLGSHMLAYTPHAVVAAPYHRNQQGVLDTFGFFNGPIGAGREILRARGIGLVAICPAMAEIRGMVEHTPDSFVSLFAAGELPGWLDEITPAGSPLRVYAVAP